VYIEPTGGPPVCSGSLWGPFGTRWGTAGSSTFTARASTSFDFDDAIQRRVWDYAKTSRDFYLSWDVPSVGARRFRKSMLGELLTGLPPSV
jgi:hypothetical protein